MRWPRQRVLLACLLILTLLAGSYWAKDLREGSTKRVVVLTPAQRVVRLINLRRASLHLVVLRRDSVLDGFARIHTRDMIAAQEFVHTTPERFSSLQKYLGRRALGEVIVWGTGGFGTPQGLFSLWMGSPGHKRVLLDRGMRRIGCSVIRARFLRQAGASVSTCQLSS